MAQWTSQESCREGPVTLALTGMSVRSHLTLSGSLTGGMPAWLADVVKARASSEPHHKVKRRALQLLALPILPAALCSTDAQLSSTAAAVRASSSPSDGAQASESSAGPISWGTQAALVTAGRAEIGKAQQRSTALQEVCSLQEQLQGAQHPEACIQLLYD